MIAASDSQRIQVVILEASAISILRKLILIFQDILLRTNLHMQVESSENGSRTVVKGSTALPPCSGFHVHFFSHFHFSFLSSTFLFSLSLFFSHFYFSFIPFTFLFSLSLFSHFHFSFLTLSFFLTFLFLLSLLIFLFYFS